ncbi:unnamed protein product, partial [marine sediment metagenome]
EKSMVKLGDVVRDTVSGFIGVATGKSEYLNGCVRYCLEPMKLTDKGDLIESHWFDKQQLEVVKERQQVESDKLLGGSRVAPTGFNDPKL